MVIKNDGHIDKLSPTPHLSGTLIGLWFVVIRNKHILLVCVWQLSLAENESTLTFTSHHHGPPLLYFLDPPPSSTRST